MSLEELGLNAEIIFLFGLQLGQSFSGPKIVDENYVRGRLVLETVGFTVRPCLIPTLFPLTLCLHVAESYLRLSIEITSVQFYVT